MTDDASSPAQHLLLWRTCQEWADLLLQLHGEHLVEAGLVDEGAHDAFFGINKTMVAALVAAGLHERAVHLRLREDDRLASLPLAGPDCEGVSGSLRHAAFTALELAPEEAREGVLRLLLKAATSVHPDQRTTWENVRDAAVVVVDRAARTTPPLYQGPRIPDALPDGRYWERGICIGDVLLTQERRARLDAMAQFLGEED